LFAGVDVIVEEVDKLEEVAYSVCVVVRVWHVVKYRAGRLGHG
jgi:hypothetical protein